MNIEQEQKHKKIIVELEKSFTKKQTIRKTTTKKPNSRSSIIGIILIIVGLILMIIPSSQNPDSLLIKIGIGLVIMGYYSIIITHEKKPLKETKDKKTKLLFKKYQFLMSEKITLILSTWIILLFFITYTATLEVFFIMILIGTLVTKELTDEYTNSNLKKRLNIFIIVFLIIFIAIISQKIINIL